MGDPGEREGGKPIGLEDPECCYRISLQEVWKETEGTFAFSNFSCEATERSEAEAVVGDFVT